MTRKYKWAKAYKGKTGDPNQEWYAYYYFMNPSTGKFDRFKVKEGMNYIHDLVAKEKYMKALVKEIDTKLEAGYDPFGANEVADKIVHEIKAETQLQENPRSPLLINAFMEFLENKRSRDLAKATMEAYQGYIGRFEYYLLENKLADVRLDMIDTKFIGDMLDWLKPVQNWEGTTYNNHLNFWVTLLNWFAKKPRQWLKREDFLIGNDGELEHKVTTTNQIKAIYCKIKGLVPRLNRRWRRKF